MAASTIAKDVLRTSTVSNSTSLFFEPAIMQTFSSLLLFGTYAAQLVLGRPSVNHRSLVQRSVDDFVEKELPIALERLLCNIGSDGCEASGASSGIVIASPSTENPDYFYTWTRDSALVFKTIVDLFIDDYDANLQAHIQNYVLAQAKLQGVSSLSGSFENGEGLGEPKYEANITAFTGDWGRPQRDGPALRAIAMITYSNWLINNGYASTASDIIWPIIRNDLAYVAQYWNQTGFDLWEEIRGSSFFTIATQHRALVQGSQLAEDLNIQCTACDIIAPHVLCFLQSFWSPEGYMIANINADTGRSGKDANTVLASIHTFDPDAGCDATTFQPCSDKALSNHKIFVDAFRSVYDINSGIPEGKAVAAGRYTEDVYFDGNPWYLNTLAAAEQLYDALYVWDSEGCIKVTSISLAFFKDFSSDVQVGDFSSDSKTYKTLYRGVQSYADGFVDIVAKYIGENGTLAEQFGKSDGKPLSARDLTWSYASFLTAAARRDGTVPDSWYAADAAKELPDKCEWTSVVGSYTSVTPTGFPTSQTPSSQPSTTTSASGPCATAQTVLVTFEESVETEYGQTIKLTGNIPALGNWDVKKAVSLSAFEYTAEDPMWKVTAELTAGAEIEYKYLNVGSNGSVTWEADPNRTLKVPVGCETEVTQSDEWQS